MIYSTFTTTSKHPSWKVLVGFGNQHGRTSYKVPCWGWTLMSRDHRGAWYDYLGSSTPDQQTALKEASELASQLEAFDRATAAPEEEP